MTPEGWIITVLVGLLGFAGGVGFAQLTIVRRLNEIAVSVMQAMESGKSAHHRLDEVKQEVDEVKKDQRQMLAMMTKLVDQANLLIQKILMEKS